MTGDEALVLSKAYTKDTAEGMGAVQGMPCQIKAVTKSDGVSTVTFLWQDNSGAEHTSAMNVSDGVSITGVAMDGGNRVSVSYSDGISAVIGTIKTEKGEQGDSGATYTPSVDADGNLSWTNDKGLENPSTVNIRGEDGQASPEQIAESVSEYMDEHGVDIPIKSVSLNGTEITPDGNKNVDIDLGEYAKSAEVATEISSATEDMATNAMIGNVLSDYATQAWVDGKGYLTQHQDLAGYATQDWVDGKGYLTQHQDLTAYALVMESGYSLGLSISSGNVLTLELKSKTGAALDTRQIDLPLESMVIGASYADGKLTLTLQNGETTECDISAIVSGLVADTLTIAGIDLKDDITKEELLGALELTSVVTDISNLQAAVEGLQTAKANTSDLAEVATSGSYADLAGTPTNVSTFENDAGYLTQHQDISGKVDKIEGKGLSSNDYTDAEKSKLDGIEDNANNYELPTMSGTAKGGAVLGDGLSVSDDGRLSVVCDASISSESANAVQNKAVAQALDGKMDATIKDDTTGIAYRLGADGGLIYCEEVEA